MEVFAKTRRLFEQACQFTSIATVLRFPVAVFGVGDYTFARGRLRSAALYYTETYVCGPQPGCWQAGCARRHLVLYSLQNEGTCRVHGVAFKQTLAAQAFLKHLCSWDSKRPITADVLKRLDLRRLAEDAGTGDQFDQLAHSSEPVLGNTDRSESDRGGPV